MQTGDSVADSVETLSVGNCDGLFVTNLGGVVIYKLFIGYLINAMIQDLGNHLLIYTGLCE